MDDRAKKQQGMTMKRTPSNHAVVKSACNMAPALRQKKVHFPLCRVMLRATSREKDCLREGGFMQFFQPFCRNVTSGL